MTTSTTSPRIFLSYRRDDSAGHVGRLYDALSDRFGKHAVFMDVDHIGAGADFVEALDRAVSACAIFIPVIGKRWTTIADDEGRRLDDPQDFVRVEIASALRRPDVRVVPVLVQGAPMPAPADLPLDVRDLHRRNAVELRDTRWREDVALLVRELEEAMDEMRRQAAPSPTAMQPLPRSRIVAAGVAMALVLFVLARCGGPPTFAGMAGVPAAVTPSDEPLEIPDDIPDLAGDWTKRARKWRKDARLVNLEASARAGFGYSIRMSFVSPQDLTGLWIMKEPNQDQIVSPTGTSVSWRTIPIEGRFIDLPTAVEAARNGGMVGTVESAELEPAIARTGDTLLVWRIRPTVTRTVGILHVDARTGRLLGPRDLVR